MSARPLPSPARLAPKGNRSSTGRRPAASLLSVALLALSSAAVAQNPWTTVKEWDSGPSANRLDIVIMGDGYTAAQMPLFRSHVSAFISYFLNEEPMNRYRNHVNIWRIEVESNESGSDKPSSCYSPQVLKDTALDSTYCASGVQRCIIADSAKVHATALVNVPEYDTIAVVVNDGEYGGCASGGVGHYTGVHSSGLEVGTHELGHSIFGLADEYGGSGTYTGGQPGAVNLSNQDASQMAAAQSKWHYWIGTEGVGAFEGGGYHDFGIWRPKQSCKMRSLGPDLCPVCREEALEDMWDFVGAPASVNPPSAGTVHPIATTLSAQIPAAASGAPFAAEWHVDGAFASLGTRTPAGASTLLSFDPSTVLGSSLSTHTVTLRVFDTTPWHKKSSAYEPVPAVSWLVSDADVDLAVTSFAVTAPPARLGERFEVTDTITNAGSTATPPFTVRYHMSAVSFVSPAQPVAGVRQVPALAPGASVTATTALRVPPHGFSVLDAYVGILVDGDGAVAETDESNNGAVSGGSFAIDTGPNLASSHATLDLGATQTVLFHVDMGAAHTGESYVLLPSLAPPGTISLAPYAGSMYFTFDGLSLAVGTGGLGAPWFQDFIGVLDPLGKATATWLKPGLPAPPPFVTFHFSCLTFGTDGAGNTIIPMAGTTIGLVGF